MLNSHFEYCSNKNFYKKIYIPLSLQLECFFFKKKTFLLLILLKKKYFFNIPFLLKFFFLNNYLYFYFVSSPFIFVKKTYKFLISFIFLIRELLKKKAKTLLLRGVGLKINYLENNNLILKLKLGYSHLIYLTLFPNIFLFFFKKKIILQSFNKVKLGNFCFLLYKYKPINIFTGKGLLIKKRKKFKLKEYIKKI